MSNAVASGSTDAKKLKKKTIITVALTGGTGSKKLNPDTPITPEEIANDAYECYKVGASVVHLHMKGDDGESASMNVGKFKKTQELIKEKCDIVINMTTSGEFEIKDDVVVIGSFNKKDELRTDVLKLKSEMGTFDIGTMNFGRAVFLNPIPFLETMGKQMQELNVKPEVECFDFGHIRTAKALIKSGHLMTPVHFQFCMGVAGGSAGTVENLEYMSRLLPEGSTWSAFGIGPSHLPVIFTTLALGGNIRVGLEDNIYYSKGKLATNVKLVERARDAILLYGNEVASPNEAREILGL
jgi:uncharacterized protein (DUF849 family)